MASLWEQKKAIAEIGKLLYDRGLLVGTEGNISIRLDRKRVLITPAGFPKRRLLPKDMVVVDLDGHQLAGYGCPSSELLMHLFVYKHRPEAGACVHSHAPFATAFAAGDVPLPENILPEVVLFVGRIPLTDYAAPGTNAVPQVLLPYIENSNAFLLRSHGLLTIGGDLEEAFHRHETVEHYARVVFLARQLGNLQAIPAGDFQRLVAMRLSREERKP